MNDKNENGTEQSTHVDRHYRILSGEWAEQAQRNVDKWGLQGVETLLLAMQEEMGELAQAHLEAHHEGGDPDRVADELADLGALCFQLQWALNSRSVDTDTEQ